MTTRRDIERAVAELEESGAGDVPDIIIRDEVVETPWSDEAGREIPAGSVTRLRWDGGEWVEE